MDTLDLIESVKTAYAAVERNDVDAYVTYFTADAVYKVGNYELVTWHEGIRALAHLWLTCSQP